MSETTSPCDYCYLNIYTINNITPSSSDRLLDQLFQLLHVAQGAAVLFEDAVYERGQLELRGTAWLRLLLALID